MGVTRKDEGAQIRWKLWLREKAILNISLGKTEGGDADGWEIVGTIRSET